ncbi:winged helix-turn-helix transcriptional regulator [Flavobacterium chryseum]|uniref:winged helix-turn-helix transcriptional regulator n=1 Tax=Flavobacterium sp. P3160 TaxID=2512113 RepID=UPI00105D7AB8|nr:winged helix DNA-binding protein [Flavobacterium sp. P3160]
MAFFLLSFRVFTVTLRRSFNFEKWVDSLTNNRVIILREIHNNSKITKKQLEKAVNLSASAIDNNIEKLKDIGLLIREGSDKGGYWKINYILP